MKRALTIFSLIIIASLSFFNGDIKASESSFFVKPILNDNQASEVPYFHFELNSEDSQKMKVLIKNTSDHSLTIEMASTNAFSNPFGNMNYSKDEETDYSKFLKNEYKMKDLVKVPEKVTLKKNEEKVVEFEITIPKSLKSGQILGALRFDSYVNGADVLENKGEAQANYEVKVKHRYSIGILVDLPIKDNNKSLSIASSKISAAGVAPQILTEILNNSSYIAKDVDIVYVVKKADRDKVLFEGRKELYNLAPATTLIFPIDWEYEKFGVGLYTIDVSLIDRDTGDTISEAKNDFEVEGGKVAEYYDKTEESHFFPKVNLLNPAWYLLIVVILVLAFYITYRLGKTNGEKKTKNDSESSIDNKEI